MLKALNNVGARAARLAILPALAWSALSYGSAICEGQPLVLRYGVVDPPVVAQRDITVSLPTSIHPQDPGPKPLECSGLAWIGDRLILSSDRHSHVVFTALLDIDGPMIRMGLPESQLIIDNEKNLLLDAEAITARPAPGGGYEVLLFCSLSNDPYGSRRVKREHLARVHVDADGRVSPRDVRVLSGESVRDALDNHFEALRVRSYSSYNVSRDENTQRWGSIEGVTWTPGGRRVLCGMRNPLAGDDAMLFALEGVDKAFDADDPALLRIADLIRIDLGGRGVTDLTWDPVTRGYLITAALSNGPKLSDDQPYPLENLNVALFWWSGQKKDKPRLVAQIEDLNVDAVCRIGLSDYIALASDEGDVSEERRGRQSVLTLMHLNAPPEGAEP